MALPSESTPFDMMVNTIIDVLLEHPQFNFDLRIAAWMGTSILREYQAWKNSSLGMQCPRDVQIRHLLSLWREQIGEAANATSFRNLLTERPFTASLIASLDNLPEMQLVEMGYDIEEIECAFAETESRDVSSLVGAIHDSEEYESESESDEEVDVPEKESESESIVKSEFKVLKDSRPRSRTSSYTSHQVVQNSDDEIDDLKNVVCLAVDLGASIGKLIDGI